MPRGQFYTVFTLGFATAVGLFGILASALVLFWHEPFWRTVWHLETLGLKVGWLSPLYFSMFVAIAGVSIGYWIVQIQQAVVRWSGNRLIAKLSEEYRALDQTLGSERANELMEQKAAAMVDESRLNLFGRQEMLHAMRAAGVQHRIS
jgi:hypothetical protein